jgi:hypothetical protein
MDSTGNARPLISQILFEMRSNVYQHAERDLHFMLPHYNSDIKVDISQDRGDILSVKGLFESSAFLLTHDSETGGKRRLWNLARGSLNPNTIPILCLNPPILFPPSCESLGFDRGMSKPRFVPTDLSRRN